MKRHILLLLGFLGAGLGLPGWSPAQTARSSLEAFLPLPVPPPRTEEAAQRYRILMRVLNKGSGTDRLARRAELIQQGNAFLPFLLDELDGRNHLAQRQACLVLMELGDPRSLNALQALVRSGHGDTSCAALALGKIEDPRAESALAALMDDGQRSARRIACLALGRLRSPGAGDHLARALQAKLDLDREAAIVGLGYAGATAHLPELLAVLRERPTDDLRRAGTLSLGFLGAPAAGELLNRLKDEDPTVRRIALEGLAQMGSGVDGLHDRLLVARVGARRGNAVEESRWALALAATGGERAGDLLEGLARHEQAEVRAGAAAGTILGPTPRAAKLAQSLLNDQAEDVRVAALLAIIADAGRHQKQPVLGILAETGDARTRRAAVLGHVYLGGSLAADGLRAMLGPTYKDDVRELAREMLAWVERDPRAAQALAGARLQVMLDEAGLAPSWNLLASTHQHVIRVLELENALPRGGGGAPPAGSGAGRALGAAANRPSLEDEDLRRHLDVHPYFDRRGETEFCR